MLQPSPQPEAASPPTGNYWAQSSRPLASLLFTMPLLVIYEAGVLLLGAHAVRNGADAWMRRWLDLLGFGQYFLLPLLTIGILLGWHHVSRLPWRTPAKVLYGMAAECGLLAVGLWLWLQIHAFLVQSFQRSVGLSLLDATGTLTSYLGAGIYEELLFRLILLSAAIALLRWLGTDRRWSIALGVLATSVLFATAHHFGPYGEPLVWSRLAFRVAAGIFFSALFLYRGFGIAAGTHAAYDVLLGLTVPVGC